MTMTMNTINVDTSDNKDTQKYSYNKNNSGNKYKREEPVLNLKDAPYKWLELYQYKHEHKIGNSSLGSLSHRLRNLVFTLSQQDDGFKDEKLLEMIDDFFKKLDKLFFCGNDDSTEVDLAESIFMYRSGKPIRSFKSSFRMTDRVMRNGKMADINVWAMIDAIHNRVDYLTHRKFGKVIYKEVKVKDTSGKKKGHKSINKRLDYRSFHGVTSEGIQSVFGLLDDLYDVTTSLHRYGVKKFHGMIKDEEKRDKEMRGNRPTRQNNSK